MSEEKATYLGGRFISKKCLHCGSDFRCPSTWRRTQWCASCSAKKKRHRDMGHAISARLSKIARAEGKQCERCEEPGYSYHHKERLADNGSTEKENLEFLCSRCHDLIHFPGVQYRYEQNNL